MRRLFRRLFRRRSAPEFNIGDMVRFGGHCVAISRMRADAAELVWIDQDKQIRTHGFVPLHKLRRAAQ